MFGGSRRDGQMLTAPCSRVEPKNAKILEHVSIFTISLSFSSFYLRQVPFLQFSLFVAYGQFAQNSANSEENQGQRKLQLKLPFSMTNFWVEIMTDSKTVSVWPTAWLLEQRSLLWLFFVLGAHTWLISFYTVNCIYPCAVVIPGLLCCAQCGGSWHTITYLPFHHWLFTDFLWNVTLTSG